jgi:hypothetical protein
MTLIMGGEGFDASAEQCLCLVAGSPRHLLAIHQFDVTPVTHVVALAVLVREHRANLGPKGIVYTVCRRRPGVPNKVTSTFRDVLTQAVSEVGDSQEVGKDGQGGLLGYLKMCGILERKTTLLLLGRILPLKITAEVKQIKETMTIEEAVADLKACGMDEMLAFYLTRYPVGRDEEDTAWADLIDLSLARDPPIDVTPEGGTGNDTAK